ncbi:hypothetical protein ACIF80_09585 [Streptomyces sp. NPDC085927]|uniref:hypothetical protein n=1 Tax=Streptomyces sp. NPDC085927 TaxID=3365738 RepID=UPI0037D29409
MTTTTIPLHDDRETTFTVQTTPVSTGDCCAEQGGCGKPGIVAVRVTIDQQRPAENSTLRWTMCPEHQSGAPRLHERQVASAREMQDPAKHAAFLAAAGVTA